MMFQVFVVHKALKVHQGNSQHQSAAENYRLTSHSLIYSSLIKNKNIIQIYQTTPTNSTIYIAINNTIYVSNMQMHE